MGGHYTWCYKKHRLVRFFFTQKIGEYAYGFALDEEEEISGDSLTVYGSTVVADASDFIRTFTQYTLDDYLYKLSIAQIQFMSVDNTHTKYLKGKDKKAWEGYKDALKAQQSLDDFMGGFNVPELAEGEEYEIKIKKKKQ